MRIFGWKDEDSKEEDYNKNNKDNSNIKEDTNIKEDIKEDYLIASNNSKIFLSSYCQVYYKDTAIAFNIT